MQQTQKILNIILLILAVVFVFGVFFGPVSSADFWWHLKSGQYIFETGSLPVTDLFSFTTEWDAATGQTERNTIFTLRQAWLGQIFMYGIYLLLSFEGIIYMRAALLTVLIMLLYRGVRREAMGLHSSLFLILPAVIIFAGFTPERPQLFSFLFFALIVFLLEGFREKSQQSRRLKPAATSEKQDSRGQGFKGSSEEAGSPRPDSVEPPDDSKKAFVYLFPLPFIMLLWANVHGGFFLGIILLSSYFSAELIKYILKRLGPPLPPKSLKALGITALVASLASLINPNGYNVFIVLMERRHGLYRYLISETVSTIEHVRLGLFGPELIMFFLLLFLCVVFFITAIIAKRNDTDFNNLFNTLPFIPSRQGRGVSEDTSRQGRGVSEDTSRQGRGVSEDTSPQEMGESMCSSPREIDKNSPSPLAGEGKGEGEKRFLCKLHYNIRRLDLTDAVTIILFAGLSLYLFRLIPFFTPLAALFIARYRLRFDEISFGEMLSISPPLRANAPSSSPLLRGGDRGEGVKSIGTPPPLPSPLKGEGDIRKSALSRFSKQSASAHILLSSLLSFILIFTLIKGNLFGRFITASLFHRSEVIVADKYPQGAVKFLKEASIPGNMFNPLDWGGYLMWRLFPDYKVFIDGRGLREDVVVQASKIMAAVKNVSGDMPEWKTYLEHYNVSMILTYSVEHFTGRMIPLIPALLNDHEWNLIYADEISLIFAKETPDNSDIIRKFQLPKERIWHEVIREAQIKSRGFFGKKVRVNFLITTGDAFLSLKDYQRAMQVYAQAWNIDPGNRMVRERMQFLNSILLKYEYQP